MGTAIVDREDRQTVNVLVKSFKKSDIHEFKDLLDAAQKWSAEAGMTEEDIQEAITAVRSSKMVCT